METTTIQVSKEIKNQLETFGSKSETFDTILRRIYSLAVKEQLREFLLSSDGCVTAEDALERAKIRWQK